MSEPQKLLTEGDKCCEKAKPGEFVCEECAAFNREISEWLSNDNGHYHK